MSSPSDAVPDSVDAVDTEADIPDVPVFDVTTLDVEDFSPFGPEEPDSTPLINAPARVVQEKAKSGPPTPVEWQNFFARFVVRGITKGYVYLILGDMADELSPSDKQKIMLTAEELDELAAPMASFSTKNSFMRKHGRTIVSAAESSEALIGLFFWMRRVNRIGKKYRQNRPVQSTVEESSYGPVGQDDGTGEFIPRYTGQYFPGTGG